MRHFVRPIFATAFVALLAGSTVSTDVFAAKAMHENFDGAWSVVINTARGNCGSGLRYGVRIVGARVVGANGGYSVGGAVAPNGAIRVMVAVICLVALLSLLFGGWTFPFAGHPTLGTAATI